MIIRKDFFNFIHVLRGLAVLLVVWSHLGGGWLSSKGLTSLLETYWENIVIKPFHLYQNGGHLGVLIFFLISGFIITHVSLLENTKEFIIKRIFRIFPTLLSTLIITYLIVHFCIKLGLELPLGTGIFTLRNYIYSLFLLDYPLGMQPVIGVTWTLFIEVLFYTLSAILLKSTKKDPLKATYFLCFLIAMNIMFSSINSTIKITANYSVYMFFLLLGRIFYFYKHKLISSSNSLLLGNICLFLFCSFYEYLYPSMLFSFSYPVFYTDLAAILIFILACESIKNTNMFFSFFADISYPLYLIHLPVGGLVLNFCYKYQISFKIAFIFSMFFLLLSSYMIWVFIERPAQLIAKKIINLEKGMFVSLLRFFYIIKPKLDW